MSDTGGANFVGEVLREDGGGVYGGARHKWTHCDTLQTLASWSKTRVNSRETSAETRRSDWTATTTSRRLSVVLRTVIHPLPCPSEQMMSMVYTRFLFEPLSYREKLTF